MPGQYTTTLQLVLEVTAVFRPIVGLDETELEAKLPARPGDNLSSNAGSDVSMDFGVGHAGVQVNDRVDIATPTSERTDVVHGICLH
jgi:hypothetical protein